MSILKIAHMGNPVLRRVAAPVDPAEICTPAFQKCCDDLLDSMIEQDGAGLAAPQVHDSRRYVVLVIDHDIGPMFLINPAIIALTDQMTSAYEGCLSVPNLRGRVSRVRHIRVEALDRDGTPFAFEAEDWAARIVVHECDHLDGVLYIDRADPKSLTFLPEFRRYGPPLPSDDDDEE